MTAFATINRAPGVYIQEVQLPGPIAGVGTSTAAFIGPARNGPMREPQRLSNWTAYADMFGVDGDPFFPQAGIFTPYALQGFFDNGGSDCWFVRVGTAAQAEATLNDRGAGVPTLLVRAQLEGTGGNGIGVTVQDAAPPLGTTTVMRAASPVTLGQNSTVQLGSPAEARKFTQDDLVEISDGTNSETRTVASVSGDTVTLTVPLTNTYDTGPPASTLRLADLPAGGTRLRLGDANGVPNVAGVERGSYLRIAISGGGAVENNVVDSVDLTTGVVELRSNLQNALPLDAGDPQVDVTTIEFTLVVTGALPNGTPVAETHAQLSMDPRHSRYFRTAVSSTLVELRQPTTPSNSPAPGNLPATGGPTPLTGGAADQPGNVGAGAFTAGIDTLRAIDEVTILCVPDSTDSAVQAYMITHCELMQDRFAVLDPRPRQTPAGIETQRNGLGSDRGFAAIYYPRIVVRDMVDAGARVTIPPSGHLAGVYARVDADRGVFKAPANEIMRGVLDVEQVITEETQGPLNEHGINVIRVFPGRGPVVWGARTISQSTQWRYVNVRRFLLFVEESLKEGTLFTVFEPNNPTLWGRVIRQVTEFLTRQFVAGALVGTTPDEAFIVQCDAELNTPGTMALGQLIIKVTLYPATPAEFVVFRIIQQPGGPLMVEE